jgi:hypothetical protein
VAKWAHQKASSYEVDDVVIFHLANYQGGSIRNVAGREVALGAATGRNERGGLLHVRTILHYVDVESRLVGGLRALPTNLRELRCERYECYGGKGR